MVYVAVVMVVVYVVCSWFFWMYVLVIDQLGDGHCREEEVCCTKPQAEVFQNTHTTGIGCGARADAQWR